MRRFALGFALLAAACGSTSLSGGGTGSPRPTSSSSPVASATAATASATAGVIVTIIPGATVNPSATPAPTPIPTPSPSPPPGGLTQAQLKFRIVDQIGRPLFCDPDFYPIARGDEQAAADQRFPEIRKDAPTFSAILDHLGIAPAPDYTSQQRLAVYREWKMLNALRLEPAGARFHFVIRVQVRGGQAIEMVDGTIDAFGSIAVSSRTPSSQPPCPICLARGTLIATPSGGVAVEDLREGDIVWTTDTSGARVAAPLVAAGSTPVPATHEVVRLVLGDGRVVLVSPGHPTADGRHVGDLIAGDEIDGARVASAARVRYGGGATFDVLPAGPTGAYWANGVPLGSTLR